jgi:hypothetical protein
MSKSQASCDICRKAAPLIGSNVKDPGQQLISTGISTHTNQLGKFIKQPVLQHVKAALQGRKQNYGTNSTQQAC